MKNNLHLSLQGLIMLSKKSELSTLVTNNYWFQTATRKIQHLTFHPLASKVKPDIFPN